MCMYIASHAQCICIYIYIYATMYVEDIQDASKHVYVTMHAHSICIYIYIYVYIYICMDRCMLFGGGWVFYAPNFTTSLQFETSLALSPLCFRSTWGAQYRFVKQDAVDHIQQPSAL